VVRGPRGGAPRIGLAIDEAQDVPVRVFEPRHLDIAGDVDVPFAPRIRQVVVLEPDALGLKRADNVLDVVNRPGESRRLVGPREV
jgi:hypothetical protein